MLAHRLPVRAEGDHFLHRDYVAEHMDAVLRAVQAGTDEVAAIASAVDAPVSLVVGWLDELALEHALPITFDRLQRRVLWEVGAGPQAMTWCPRCGGPERPAGGGLRRCSACGWEHDV